MYLLSKIISIYLRLYLIISRIILKNDWHLIANCKEQNNMNQKTVSILGATGSIGIQTLDVIKKNPENYNLNYLTINSNYKKLLEILDIFNPHGVVITDENAYKEFKASTNFKGEILFGYDSLNSIASDNTNDLLVSALVGFSGVIPTYLALQNRIDVALANKETLVSAGNIITQAAKNNNSRLIAIDSEHSAILQCLVGEEVKSVEKIILTASGGPFRNTDLDDFKNITVKQALNHPNWSMGSKITIDSSTMMNKGFEVIEAHWLFGTELSQIDVTIHPQSIIHSMVQFVDGSIKAQLGLPDMKIPISYALNYPERLYYDFQRLTIDKMSKLEFYEPDFQRYPCLRLSYESMERGGNSNAVLNASNEVCVAAFLEERISFIEINQIIEKTLSNIDYIENPDLNQIIETDLESRKYTENLINKKK